MKGYLLIQTQTGMGASVVDEVARIPGVLNAEHVHGAYDVIAEIANTQRERVSTAIRSLDGVLRAVSLVPEAA